MKLHFLFLFVLLLAGCQQLDDSQVVSPDIAISVSPEGYLQFDNQETFLETWSKLANSTKEERIQWEHEIGFDSSMRSLYDSLISADSTLDEIDSYSSSLYSQLNFISDETITSILNKQSIFAVGDKIHLITPKKELIFKKGLLKNINDYISDPSKEHDGVESFGITSETSVATSYNGRTLSTQQLCAHLPFMDWNGYSGNGKIEWWVYSKGSGYQDCEHKTLHFITTSSWTFYHSTYVFTYGLAMTNQKYYKDCWVCNAKWHDEPMDYAKISINYNLGYENSDIQHTSGTIYNQASLRFTGSRQLPYPIGPILPSLSGYQEFTYKEGNIGPNVIRMRVAAPLY